MMHDRDDDDDRPRCILDDVSKAVSAYVREDAYWLGSDVWTWLLGCVGHIQHEVGYVCR